MDKFLTIRKTLYVIKHNKYIDNKSQYYFEIKPLGSEKTFPFFFQNMILLALGQDRTSGVERGGGGTLSHQLFPNCCIT